jgi:hypothetical protein
MIDHHFSHQTARFGVDPIFGQTHIHSTATLMPLMTHMDPYCMPLHPLHPLHATLAALSMAHLGVRSEAAAYELRPRQTDAACARNWVVPNYQNVRRFQNDLPRLMPNLVIPHLISLDPRISYRNPLGDILGSSDPFLFGSGLPW